MASSSSSAAKNLGKVCDAVERNDQSTLNKLFRRWGKSSTAKLLQRHTANGRTVLHIAAEKDIPSLIALLVKHGSPLDAIDESQWTPLHESAKMHAFAASRELVRLGADPGHPTGDDTTAIHYLCSRSPNDHAAFQDLLSWMLEGRTHLVNCQNHNKETPLHYAVSKQSSLAVVSALLSYPNIDLNPVNKLKSTPLEICILRKNLKMARILVHAGAQITDRVRELAVTDEIKEVLADKPRELGRTQSSLLIATATEDQMTILDLTNTGLKEVPKSLLKCRRLVTLMLGSNELSALPEGLHRSLPHLQTLDLFENQLASLPNDIVAMTTLESLDLRRNQLTELPSLFSDLCNLLSLDLSENLFTELPGDIGLLPSLEQLTVSSNPVKELPESLASSSSLVILDARHCRINRISRVFGETSSLAKFSIKGNPLVYPPKGVAALGTQAILKFLRRFSSEAPLLKKGSYDELEVKDPVKTSTGDLSSLLSGSLDSLSMLSSSLDELSVEKSESSNTLRNCFTDSGGMPPPGEGVAVLTCPRPRWIVSPSMPETFGNTGFSSMNVQSHYRDTFFGKPHVNMMGVLQDQSLAIISIAQVVEDDHYKVLVRKQDGDLLVFLPAVVQSGRKKQSSFAPTSTLVRLLGRVYPLPGSIHMISSNRFPFLYLDLEDRMLLDCHKVGLLHVSNSFPDLNDPEAAYYGEGSDEFHEFLLLFPQPPVALKGFEQYNGGLDVVNDSTGTHSMYVKFKDIQLMFHVSPFLPQKTRRPLISRDVVIVVFLDSTVKQFDPSSIVSVLGQVLIVIQPASPSDEEPKKQEKENERRYRVEVLSVAGAGNVHPGLPDPPLLRANELMDFLLLKIINSERTVLRSGNFADALESVRCSLLADFVLMHGLHKPTAVGKRLNRVYQKSVRESSRLGASEEQSSGEGAGGSPRVTSGDFSLEAALTLASSGGAVGTGGRRHAHPHARRAYLHSLNDGQHPPLMSASPGRSSSDEHVPRSLASSSGSNEHISTILSANMLEQSNSRLVELIAAAEEEREVVRDRVDIILEICLLQLDTVCSQGDGLRSFRAFLRSEFAEENYLFWEETRKLRKCYRLCDFASAESSQSWWADAQRVYGTYLAADSPTPVNLPDDIASVFHDLLGDAADEAPPPERSLSEAGLLAKSYDAAGGEVYSLLRNDSFARWLLTEQGKAWSARLANHPSK
eukprot:CAMPEP_0177645560 /NCGR_PEP_ID=MMETSP0447-20121125/9315_1 /TAXON_ID=0 /ORGANISM="Stygamoeba regulata, Strain BSH-02190019" /LENGTH=1198 /DNA_ID=CAMNT_0019148053 /DNA_START=596 /DNA_END=4192 /DNA_ORIENTATION=+